MATLTVNVRYESSEGSGVYTSDYSYDSEVVYPLSVHWGFPSNKPNMPHIAGTGTANFFLDNLSSDLPWTEASSDGNIAGKGVGSRIRLFLGYGSDNQGFMGRITEWYPFPGLFDERLTEVTAYDYMYDLMQYTIDGVAVQTANYANNILPILTSDLPYPPYRTNYQTGYVFPLSFHDLYSGQTKAISGVSKLAGSEFAHVYCDDENLGWAFSGTLNYVTNNEWINSGASIGTLDNRFTSLEINKTRELNYCPIYVTYNPATIGDSDEILALSENDLHIPAGDSKTVRLRYRDPANDDTFVSCLDTDIVTPALNTDYIFTFEGEDDADSDVAVTFTNKNSAGEYLFANNGNGDVTVNPIQVRGKPIYMYDKVTLVSPASDALPGSVPLEVNLPYMVDAEFATAVMNFLHRTYAIYQADNIAQSISFVATADSDILNLALNAEIGSSFTLIEDVNVINENYRITSIDWDIYAPDLAWVTWGIYPDERISLHMVDSSGQHMADSNGMRFAFWR